MKFLISAVLALAAICAGAQTPTVTTPQSVTNAAVLGANGTIVPLTSACLSNLGQTVHVISYGGRNGANINGARIRLEASYNSDSATCTTGNWFSISDEGTNPGSNNTNLLLGTGVFPFLRVNLVACGASGVACDGNLRVVASYTGSSAMPANVFGSYGAGQQIRKVIFLNQSSSVNQISSGISTPYGSTAGFLVLNGTGFTAGGTIAVTGSGPAVTFTIPAAGGAIIIPVPASPGTAVSVVYTSAGAGNTFSVDYYFFPPALIQPAGTQPANTANSEATAAVNTAVVTTLTPNSFQRAFLFNVSARCSAGTAQLTVADGATQIYSTSATQVGTTNFDKQWVAALPASPGNNLVITLGTCGGGNTGTLDVQGSVF